MVHDNLHYTGVPSTKPQRAYVSLESITCMTTWYITDEQLLNTISSSITDENITYYNLLAME